MDKKGQGALEYLLLIGGAVLVAVIVVVLLLNITHAGTNTTTTVAGGALCTQLSAAAGAGTGDACSGTVTIEGTAYTCTGTYPDCTI